MTDSAIIQLSVAGIMAMPALLASIMAAVKAHKAEKSSLANNVKINELEAHFKNISEKLDGRLSELLKVVKESATLQGAADERARGDARSAKTEAPIKAEIVNSPLDPVPVKQAPK